MQLPVELGDAIRVRQVVVHRLAGQAMGSRAIRLFPADRRINRHVGHVNTLRHQLPRHALRQARLAVRRRGKRATARIALQCGAGVGENYRALVAVLAVE